MAKTSRQTAIFGTEDWKKLYKTYKEADLQSYNFETIRKTFVDYLRQHHPENFNDFTENSEYIVLLDLIAFMGQSLSFRNDLNTRENFLDTAERRDSVNNLAELVSYTPKRNEASQGFIKITSVTTTENISDFNRNNLSNTAIRWNDKTNDSWQEQFTLVLNAALVDSQKIGQPGRSVTIVGIQTDEYQVNLANGFLPVIPFSATVDGTAMDFEIVNGTSVNKDFIYEPAPIANAPMNILYRNDNQGFASANTGYFFFFKQGLISTEDFNLDERIANRTIEANPTGVNNNDVWLYKLTDNDVADQEWSKVDNIYSSNGVQLAAEERQFFSLSSRAEDQITYNFGDGVFSEIPVGSFRSYTRQSNGLEYVINQEEIQNLDISLNYISKTGRSETITMAVSLTSPVSNAKSTESLDDIKRRAPARFYTQDRMVNGEDYNNFPFSSFSSIIKSKAVNRTNIGASRYLDLVDPTGKYSSINTYGSDGLLYKDSVSKSFIFTFTDRNDIESVLRNKVEPLLAGRGTIQFYYEQFPRPDLSAIDIEWQQSTTTINNTSGYFKNAAGNPLPIGPFVGGNKQYLLANALVKFVPPTGYHFSSANKLVLGASTRADDKSIIWATITDVFTDGTNQGVGNFIDGTGPVLLNNFVPTQAIPVEIIPLFNTDLPVALEQEMLAQVVLLRNFGIGFDHLANEWYLISADNLNVIDEFSLDDAKDISNTNKDASWIMKFISTPQGYEVTSRTLHYFFASILETRFFFDNSRQIFDPRSGKIIDDFIRVLKTNSKPDGSNQPLESDVVMDIIDQSVEVDGFVNDYNVEVSFTDSDNDGIADDPDFFLLLVDETGINVNRNTYFQSTVDFDNLERFLPISSDLIIDENATKETIELVKTEHVNGQLFYAFSELNFYKLVVNGIERDLELQTDLISKIGRDTLHFQYRHNSPETRRINPGVTNIIDIYLVTAGYNAAFSRYVQDATGTVPVPPKPTVDDLTVLYENLQESRMVSDNMVLSSVCFKPLFGDKADEELQAYIKVVKLNNTTTSDSEIKSQVISKINTYFDIDNWEFGDTFYFSELSAFLHSELGDILGSVVILPKDPSKPFGNLYEIGSAPNEIFVNAATVEDVNIIDALTASQLQNGAG